METKMTVFELTEMDILADATLSRTLFLSQEAAIDAGNQAIATLDDETDEEVPQDWQDFEDGNMVWTWRSYVLRIEPRDVLGF